MSKNSTHDTYNNDYLPYIIKWGRITNWTGVVASFLPAMVLAFYFDLLPSFTQIMSGFVLIASMVGAIWIIEPVSYFPIIGVPGTYMAFISGNIGNLRIPCAMMAQEAAGIQPGTDQGSIVATLGMAVSILINVTILTVGVVAGASVLKILPQPALDALQYILPALFGSIFVQFSMSKLKLAPFALIISLILVIAVQQGIIPSFSSTFIAVFSCIGIAILLYKKGIIS